MIIDAEIFNKSIATLRKLSDKYLFGFYGLSFTKRINTLRLFITNGEFYIFTDIPAKEHSGDKLEPRTVYSFGCPRLSIPNNGRIALKIKNKSVVIGNSTKHEKFDIKIRKEDDLLSSCTWGVQDTLTAEDLPKLLYTLRAQSSMPAYICNDGIFVADPHRIHGANFNWADIESGVTSSGVIKVLSVLLRKMSNIEVSAYKNYIRFSTDRWHIVSRLVKTDEVKECKSVVDKKSWSATGVFQNNAVINALSNTSQHVYLDLDKELTLESDMDSVKLSSDNRIDMKTKARAQFNSKLLKDLLYDHEDEVKIAFGEEKQPLYVFYQACKGVLAPVIDT